MRVQAKWIQKQYFGVNMNYDFGQCEEHKGKQHPEHWYFAPDEPRLAEFEDEQCFFCLDGDDI